jgi:hypothetical protein
MKVEGVHNVMVLEQGAVYFRGVHRPRQPFWLQHNYPRNKGREITIFNNPYNLIRETDNHIAGISKLK